MLAISCSCVSDASRFADALVTIVIRAMFAELEMRAVPLSTLARQLACLALFGGQLAAQSARERVPLPEHPRPDFQRADWLNLNGHWQFAFDPHDQGERARWPSVGLPKGREILVPFSWGAPLSGVPA